MSLWQSQTGEWSEELEKKPSGQNEIFSPASVNSPAKIYRPILEDLKKTAESEIIVSPKSPSMRGLFDELLYSLNAMTFEWECITTETQRPRRASFVFLCS
jgi:hypothetical protein